MLDVLEKFPVTTAENGTYTIEGLVNGSYCIQVEKEGYFTSNPVNITVADGDVIVDIVLNEYVDVPTYTMTVRVVDDEGVPVSGGTVAVGDDCEDLPMYNEFYYFDLSGISQDKPEKKTYVPLNNSIVDESPCAYKVVSMGVDGNVENNATTTFSMFKSLSFDSNGTGVISIPAKQDEASVLNLTVEEWVVRSIDISGDAQINLSEYLYLELKVLAPQSSNQNPDTIIGMIPGDITQSTYPNFITSEDAERIAEDMSCVPYTLKFTSSAMGDVTMNDTGAVWIESAQSIRFTPLNSSYDTFYFEILEDGTLQGAFPVIKLGTVSNLEISFFVNGTSTKITDLDFASVSPNIPYPVETSLEQFNRIMANRDNTGFRFSFNDADHGNIVRCNMGNSAEGTDTAVLQALMIENGFMTLRLFNDTVNAQITATFDYDPVLFKSVSNMTVGIVKVDSMGV
jgi:hypothetical protein